MKVRTAFRIVTRVTAIPINSEEFPHSSCVFYVVGSFSIFA